MGIESVDIKKAADASGDFDDSMEPTLGGFAKKRTAFHKHTEMRYLKGCLDEPEIRAQVEELMTRSMHSPAMPKNVGDVAVISEQRTFDKEGLYHVVIKYMIVPDRQVKK